MIILQGSCSMFICLAKLAPIRDLSFIIGAGGWVRNGGVYERFTGCKGGLQKNL